MARLGPVLELQPGHASELARIVCRESHTKTARMRGDEEIVGSNHGSLSLQCSPDLGIVARRVARIIKDVDIAEILIERRTVLLAPPRYLDSEFEFCR